MKKPRLLLILLPLVLSGCTNVAGDITRTIHALPASTLNNDTLFSAASEFFSREGYQCIPERDANRFRCSREMRDLYIHQTRAVVQIFPDGDEGLSYTLVTTRWDEGLIPGELISSDFTNPDVAAFCTYLQEQEVGHCRSEMMRKRS